MRRGRFFRSTDGIQTNEVRDKIKLHESESIGRATTTADNFFILNALFCSSLVGARTRVWCSLCAHICICLFLSMNDCTLNSTDNFLLSIGSIFGKQDASRKNIRPARRICTRNAYEESARTCDAKVVGFRRCKVRRSKDRRRISLAIRWCRRERRTRRT